MVFMFKSVILSLLLGLLLSAACSGPTYRPVVKGGPSLIKDSVLADGLHYPWEILWGPDGHIWMTEREGRISRIDPVTGKLTPLLQVPGTVARGEGGLLGMVLHPRFADTPHLFVACNYEGPKGYKEKIIRYTYNGSGLVDPLVIFDNIEAAYIHNGCRLLILPDNTLLFSTGDAANQSLPQNKSSVNGKMLRIHLDGSIPADNPMPGSPVWSLGHRNAQGLVLANGILYSSEHGPDTDDELNILEKGAIMAGPR
jgi:aldose sugar dehydrogenase